MSNHLSCQWVGGVIVDDWYKKGLSCLWTQCSPVYISTVAAPEFDNREGAGYTDTQLPVLSLFAICQAPSVEYTPGCLWSQPSGIYSHNSVRVCLQYKSMRVRLVEDNSLYICLYIIVVWWPQTLHDAGVLCLMRLVAGGFCAAVVKRLLSYLCWLFTQMLAGCVIRNMTKIWFVWREDSTIACLLKTNSSTGRRLLSKQTD